MAKNILYLQQEPNTKNICIPKQISVVDANELFAGIIAKGKNLQSWTRGILFSDEVELFAPFRLLAELEKNRDEKQSRVKVFATSDLFSLFFFFFEL